MKVVNLVSQVFFLLITVLFLIYFLTGLNAYSKSIDFYLPKCEYNWLKVIDTSMPEIFEPLTINEKSISIKSRSSLLIISEEVFGAKNNLF